MVEELLQSIVMMKKQLLIIFIAFAMPFWGAFAEDRPDLADTNVVGKGVAGFCAQALGSSKPGAGGSAFAGVVSAKRALSLEQQFIGVLGVIENSREVLVMTEILAGGHESILKSMRAKYGSISRVLWMGELEFSNDGSQLIRANETSGLYFKSTSTGGRVQVDHLEVPVENTVRNLHKYLQQTNMRVFQFEGAEWASFDSQAPHLFRTLNRMKGPGVFTHLFFDRINSFVMFADLDRDESPLAFLDSFVQLFGEKSALAERLEYVKIFFAARANDKRLSPQAGSVIEGVLRRIIAGDKVFSPEDARLFQQEFLAFIDLVRLQNEPSGEGGAVIHFENGVESH